MFECGPECVLCQSSSIAWVIHTMSIRLMVSEIEQFKPLFGFSLKILAGTFHLNNYTRDFNIRIMADPSIWQIKVPTRLLLSNHNKIEI